MVRNGWFGWEREDAPRATRDHLSRVHPLGHVDLIADLCASGGGAIDLDTSAGPGTYEAALRASGGAVALVDALLRDGDPCGVSALRPPGHHAEKARAMGFCFFNNVAVAAAHARTAHGADRVLVFDWDVHHGNGTQEIFYASPHVLFISAHQWPLYPGTGRGAELGSGEGQGHTVNLPVPPGTGDAGYVSLAEHVVAPLIAAYDPQLVLVSAGFDAHVADPLASCQVTEAGYAQMTAALRRACDALEVPLGLVLEGGYSVEALAGSVCELMPVLLADATPDAPDVAVDDLARAAHRRLEPYWPGLAATSA